MSPNTAGPLTAQALARRGALLDQLAGAALRALSGDPRFAWHKLRPYSGQHLVRWLAPHLSGDEGMGLTGCRAAADATALRALHTPSVEHLSHAPPQPLARLFYEWFETFRVEALVPERWPGVRQNIERNFSDWTGRFYGSPLMESRLGPLLFAIVVFVRYRLHGIPPDEQFQDAMAGTLRRTMTQLGPTLRVMVRNLHAPAQFAPANAILAMRIAELVEDMTQGAPAPARDQALNLGAFHIPFDPAPEDEDIGLPVAPRTGTSGDALQTDTYHVFTQQFDRQIHATRLVRPAQLDTYAAHLSAQFAELKLPLRRLARELSTRLQHPETDSWAFDQETGRIDARQLTRLFTSPMERRIFQLPQSSLRVDAAISLLIDCTGSMRQHASQVALFALALNRMAAFAHIPLEILGFGTGSWNGGAARTLWLQRGRAPSPGRVAERLHAVFQESSDRPVRARRAIGALLKADTYREGLDGEAVQWASTRLRGIEARRRILLVISDGCPSETATAQLNPPGFLERHLLRVVRRQERNGMEIVGIGLGLDLRNYYSHSLPIEPEDLPCTRTFSQLWDFLPPLGSRLRA